jgi:hypothetical protein
MPFSGVRREPAPCNEGNQDIRNPSIKVDARDFADAYIAAQNIMKGIRCDGRVWEISIDSIQRVSS